MNCVSTLINNAKLIPNPFNKKDINLYAVNIEDLHKLIDLKKEINDKK